MSNKIDLERIRKKAEIFRCVRHKKAALLKIETDVIVITACCEKFQDHIESFIERQIELASNEESREQM